MNLTVVQLDDRTDQRQTQPGTASFPARSALRNPIENMLLGVGRDPRAVVLDLQNSRVVLLFESDVDSAAAGRVFDRVLSEVENEAKEQRVIALDPQRRSRSDRVLVSGPCRQLSQSGSDVFQHFG